MKHQLDFEKPILELQRKLEELKEHPETHSLGLSFDEEVAMMEKKIEETRRQIFADLSPWDRVQLARHRKRPFMLDYAAMTFSDFSELHGDRLFADDHAVVGGFAKLGEHRVLLMIGSGMTPSEIAKELNLSVKTVSTYRSRILEKLELQNNAQLIHYVLTHALSAPKKVTR